LSTGIHKHQCTWKELRSSKDVYKYNVELTSRTHRIHGTSLFRCDQAKRLFQHKQAPTQHAYAREVPSACGTKELSHRHIILCYWLGLYIAILM